MKIKDNYDKERKSWCFNCSIYKHMAKDCRKLKKERAMKKCYKYDKVGHLAKNCRAGQKIKNRSVQENSEDKNKKNNDREVGFVKDLE